MNRRAILLGMPALGATLPCGLAAMPESEVAAKYREWKGCADLFDADDEGRTEAQSSALADTMFRLADEILDLPSRGPMDLIYKLMAYTLDGSTDPLDGEHGHKIYAEARAMLRK